MSDWEESTMKEVELAGGAWVSKYGRPRSGWGCLLESQGRRKRFGEKLSTRSENRLELAGIVAGLRELKYPCRVRVTTANSYLYDCGKELLKRRSSTLFVAGVMDGTVKNSDLWKEFRALGKIHVIEMAWVSARSRHNPCVSARSEAQNAALRPAFPSTPTQLAGPVAQSPCPSESGRDAESTPNWADIGGAAQHPAADDRGGGECCAS
jgi:ribonuclease HI